MIDELAEWIENTFTKYHGMSSANGLVPGGIPRGKVSDPAIMFVSKRQESSGSESPTQIISRGVGMLRGESSRIAGQIITEKELVRRRRLQDSHLFD